MTKQQLSKALAAYPDDAEILVFQTDEQGLHYHKVQTVEPYAGENFHASNDTSKICLICSTLLQ